MTYELDEKSEREKIIDIGFAHILKKTGYEKVGLIFWATEVENILYDMGVLACMGIEGDELKAQEIDLLNRAKALIEQNRQDERSIDSNP